MTDPRRNHIFETCARTDHWWSGNAEPPYALEWANAKIRSLDRDEKIGAAKTTNIEKSVTFTKRLKKR